MEREIKFRAWDEGNKVMHYDFQFIKSGEGGNDWIVFVSDKQKLNDKPRPLENPYFANQFKIMQFIGLLDVNNKEIYEGDIVRLSDRGRGEVKFHSGCYYHTAQLGSGVMGATYWYEVIGNIYESPELLKEREDEKHS